MVYLVVFVGYGARGLARRTAAGASLLRSGDVHRRPGPPLAATATSTSRRASSTGVPIRLGTWNLTWWTAERLAPISTLGVQLLAVQETKLASLPLESARASLKPSGYVLHHGHAVPARRAGGHGDRCGVGVIASPGVAVTPLPPLGAAWRRLYAMCRVHGVQIPHRPGLPLGLRIFTVYAPLPRDEEKEIFTAAFLEMVSGLDMQVPTLFLGDFNGTVNPAEDYASGEGSVCRLLSHLLGPGGPLLDLQLVVSPESRAYTFCSSKHSVPSRSRCDLALGNRAALGLISRVFVDSSIMDGGHSPLLIELKDSSTWALPWFPPRPQLPPALRQSGADLRASKSWKDILDHWQGSTTVLHLLDKKPNESAQKVSSLLDEAVQELVSSAGGWSTRSAPRRPAFESQQVRRYRAHLRLLSQCSALLTREQGVGSFSHKLLGLLSQLHRRGFVFDGSCRFVFLQQVDSAVAALRHELAASLRAMRAERAARWRDRIPALWDANPAVLYRWLAADTPAWGSVPILTLTGAQCTTIDEVDATVQDFWVRQVWRLHAKADEGANWAAFQSSQFFLFIPQCRWPQEHWTLERVQGALRRMREGSAPGVRGVPIAVWKTLPEAFLKRVADLLHLIEAEGVWPRELLQAYVAMIPKPSGGPRPQDQRPITVLDVVYRIWAKGVTLTWAPVLHGQYLGPSAFGFRAQAGPIHVAQLLTDVIELQRRRRLPLWLISFDVEKCFPSLPWWAVFGVLSHVGVDPKVVRCFRSFYSDLRHHFRYGHVDGAPWSMANGLAQGCPASPDLMNILFEPFHRWAEAQKVGVTAGDTQIASSSFADDIVLLGASLPEVEFLVNGYQLWCRLLGIKLNLAKTQLWSNQGSGGQRVLLTLVDGSLELTTRATFRMVGVELGSNERVATQRHLEPRLAKALLAGKRLASIDVPTAVAAQLWRTTVLPQALYGCEVRRITSGQLRPLCIQGRQVVARKAPVALSHYGAMEVVCGLPLGKCAVRDPRLEVLSRRLKWLHLLANQSGLVGTVHRGLATTPGPHWVEPTPSLALALSDLGWSVVINLQSVATQRWPHLASERAYGGLVRLVPTDDPPPMDTIWTDGSIRDHGGAAALQAATDCKSLCSVASPRSSTQCELVALSLVAQFQPAPSLVLTDSLCALQLLSSWAQRSPASVLSCNERVEVRLFLHQWHESARPPALEKVKAHDDKAVLAGALKAVGNHRVDALAKEAAVRTTEPYTTDLRFVDAVQILDASGVWVLDIAAAVTQSWWEARSREGAQRRAWLATLYPAAMGFDWAASVALFLPPMVVEGKFVHRAPPPVLKWVARARSGALATRARLAGVRLGLSSQCPCCPAMIEDDMHAAQERAHQIALRRRHGFGIRLP